MVPEKPRNSSKPRKTQRIPKKPRWDQSQLAQRVHKDIHTYIHSMDTIAYIHTHVNTCIGFNKESMADPGHHQEQSKDKAKLPTGSITWRAAHHNQNCRPKGKHTHIHDRLRGGPNNSSCPLFSRHCHRRSCIHIWILTSLGSSSAQATRSSEFNAGTGSA